MLDRPTNKGKAHTKNNFDVLLPRAHIESQENILPTVAITLSKGGKAFFKLLSKTQNKEAHKRNEGKPSFRRRYQICTMSGPGILRPLRHLRDVVVTLILQFFELNWGDVHVRITVTVAIPVGELCRFIGREYFFLCRLSVSSRSCLLHQLYLLPVFLLHVFRHGVLVHVNCVLLDFPGCEPASLPFPEISPLLSHHSKNEQSLSHKTIRALEEAPCTRASYACIGTSLKRPLKQIL